MTRKDAIDAIHTAKEVYVQPRVGVNERWVRIAKREAEYLLRGFERDGEIDVDLDCKPSGEIYLG